MKETVFNIILIIAFIAFLIWFVAEHFFLNEPEFTDTSYFAGLEIIDYKRIEVPNNVGYLQEYILRDPESNILYCALYIGRGFAMEMLRNADGTPKTMEADVTTVVQE